MNKSKVFLISLGEVAFLLLFCVMILLLPRVQRVQADLNRVRTEIQRLGQLQVERDKLKTEIDLLKRRLDEEGKLSDIDPVCGDHLFRVMVKSSNTFEIDGRHLTIKKIGRRYDERIKEAKNGRCRHKILAKAAEGLELKPYLVAINKLERYFYVVRALE